MSNPVIIGEGMFSDCVVVMSGFMWDKVSAMNIFFVFCFILGIGESLPSSGFIVVDLRF